MTKSLPILEQILAKADLANEDGEHMADFEMRGRDSLDFTNVSRATLQRMLEEAYAAGHIDAGKRQREIAA